ncbi:hypothetical protein D3C81_2219840 [compost metagenome]
MSVNFWPPLLRIGYSKLSVGLTVGLTGAGAGEAAGAAVWAAWAPVRNSGLGRRYLLGIGQ